MTFDLSNFPRVGLAHLPTPFEPLNALSEHLGGPKIWAKRDDCTGLAGGGNKTRKLEFLIGDALSKGADTIVTVGATQSNHVRQSVAAAAKVGLKAEVLLERAVIRDEAYANNGNIMLDHLLGAKVHECDASADLNLDGQLFAMKLAEQGHTPYFIPMGGSSVVGALGYTSCIFELMDDADNNGINIDGIVHASSSQGTQAGLLAGLIAAESTIPVYGISVGRDQTELSAMVLELTEQTLEYAGLTKTIDSSSVICSDKFCAPGYGEPNSGMIEAVQLCAQLEGVLLDPVYTGKAMAGLISMIRDGQFKQDQNIVFIHTGGQTALHAYPSIFKG